MSLRAALTAVLLMPAALIATNAVRPAAAQDAPAAKSAAAADAGENAPETPDPGPDAGADALPIPPIPPRIADTAPYDTCMDMVASDPSGADAMATAWPAAPASELRGEPAEHCHAMAQIELGNPASGAELLDRLAAASHAPAASRAEILGQADQAWIMAGRPDHAYASATQAIVLDPENPELRIGHAIAAIAEHHNSEAIDDLTQALDQDPKRPDALVLRATARRNLNQLDAAASDIDAALRLDGDNADAYLERGIIRQRHGDLAGARADWQLAADLSPDTPTADLAAQDLALLDAGPPQ